MHLLARISFETCYGGPSRLTSRFLLTGQILFSLAFVGSCELHNWISVPKETNACLERWMTVSALFFPSGMQTAAANNQPALAPGRRGVFR